MLACLQVSTAGVLEEMLGREKERAPWKRSAAT